MQASKQILPTSEIAAAPEGSNLTFADAIALYGQLGTDPTYVPSEGEFREMQNLASMLGQTTRLDEDGIASWPYVGPHGEPVNDEAAATVRSLADPTRWLLDADQEKHLLNVARGITESPLEGSAQEPEMRWLLHTLEGVGLEADRIGLDDLNRVTYRVTKLSRLARFKLEQQGVDVEKLIRDRARRYVGRAGSMNRIDLAQTDEYSLQGLRKPLHIGRVAMEIDRDHLHEQNELGSEEAWLQVLTNPSIQTKDQVANALYPERTVGGSRVYGWRTGFITPKSVRQEQRKLKESYPERYALDETQQAVVDRYAGQLERLRPLERQVRIDARRQRSPLNEYFARHALFPSQGTRGLTPSEQDLLTAAQQRLMTIRSNEMTQWKTSDTVREKLANVRGRVRTSVDRVRSRLAQTPMNRPVAELPTRTQVARTHFGATPVARPWNEPISR